MAGSAQLEWSAVDDGFSAGRYRITRFSEPFDPSLNWRLEVIDVNPGAAWRLSRITLHASLDEARAAARRDHRDRLRRARIGWHLSIGGAAWAGILFVSPFAGFFEFIASVTLLNLGTGAFLDALRVLSYAGWGAMEKADGPEPVTWIDRGVVALVRSMQARRDSTPAGGGPDPAIVVEVP